MPHPGQGILNNSLKIHGTLKQLRIKYNPQTNKMHRIFIIILFDFITDIFIHFMISLENIFVKTT